MAASASTRTIAVGVGELQYVTVKGEGRNSAMEGQPPNMQYMASIILKKDSPEHKNLKAIIDDSWKTYCAEFGVKGPPKSTGIKPVMVDTEEMDEYGAPIKKETDEVRVTMKTGVKWPDGKTKVVKVFQPSGADITAQVTAADWTIGNGSLGILHGIAQSNNAGGTHKVTLYLSGVQLTKLVKYTGADLHVTAVDVDDVELDLDLDMPENGAATPKI